MNNDLEANKKMHSKNCSKSYAMFEEYGKRENEKVHCIILRKHLVNCKKFHIFKEQTLFSHSDRVIRQRYIMSHLEYFHHEYEVEMKLIQLESQERSRNQANAILS